jgi:eukaryotic-like serine/threonine-protein kinase
LEFRLAIRKSSRRYPDDTLVKFTIPPAICAQIELNRNNPSKAIELLQTAAPYELSDAFLWGFLGPVYVRGEAYLMAHKGIEAAGEFQKILDHRGIVVNSPIGALAHLQLGRAYALMGESTKAKTVYQELFTLWKDADPDIPVLKQAEAEYAKVN